MYESLRRPPRDAVDLTTPKSVRFHRGNTHDFLSRHTKVTARYTARGLPGVRELAPELLRHLADPRALRLAFDHLAAHGGPAPGPDGWRYEDFADHEVWSLCRALGQLIRRGRYRPGPERVVWISKGPGRGDRPLVLQNIADRVVQRAALIILQPILDPLFDERSFGFRPDRDRLQALALAERLARDGPRRWCVTEDIRDAFTNVPVSRLLQVVRTYLPTAGLDAFLGRAVPGRALPGLRQGGALSPLLLNLYLHHLLDRPWRRDHPDWPLIRVADDILVITGSQAEAHSAHAALAGRVRAAGLALKGTADTAVHALTRADPAHWLGLRVHLGRVGLVARLGPAEWARLAARLARAHHAADAPVRAAAVVRGWLGQAGPCFPKSPTARQRAVRRVAAVAARLAFDEIPGPLELAGLWQRAWARWGRRRAAAARAPVGTGGAAASRDAGAAAPSV